MFRSGCPIASTLDLVGDKWTLIIVRDMLTGKRKFGDFLASPEGITTNILSDRLKTMVEHGLVNKSPYQDKPVRYDYALTDKGRALHPALIEICKWANTQIKGTWVPPARFMENHKS